MQSKLSVSQSSCAVYKNSHFPLIYKLEDCWMIHNTINFVQGIITQHEIGDIWLDSFTLNKPDKVNNDLATPPSADNLP